jgi:ER degradation enhancer, mannosidase alpha-like 1
MAGIGAGVDSFYEYLIKSHILFGNTGSILTFRFPSIFIYLYIYICTEYWKMYQDSYTSILKYIKDNKGFFYTNVNMDKGDLYTTWVDSLSAFLPGMQVDFTK